MNLSELFEHGGVYIDNSRENIMKRPYKFFAVLAFFYIAFSAVAQESKLVVVDTTSKELKRSAHRLGIPVEQLRKARQTLQDATDLARKIKPYPVGQLSALINSWQQLNRSRTKAVVDSFIQDLRSEAAKAADPQTYMQATSTAMSLMQSNAEFDYEKLQQMLRSWPDPPASIAEAAGKFRDGMEASLRQSAMWRLANTDPEKALTFLSSSGDSGGYNYPIAAQIAQGFMNAGRKDEAFGIIEQTISDFSQHATDPRALQAYENFVQMSARSLDSGRAAAAINPLVAQLRNQAPSAGCNGTLKVDNTSVDLTCAESRILNLVRSLPMKPGLVQTTLDSLPDLKSKLDSVGGVDNLYGGSGMSFAFNTSTGSRSMPGSMPVDFVNQSKLFQELKGKAESNPGFVKRKLQDAANGQQGMEMLVNLAMMAAYQDDALASLALEIAQQLVPQIEPLQRRSMVLQSLIRAYRQLDGEVDQGLLRNGFVLADQLRQEQSEKYDTPDQTNPMRQPGSAPADQLEAFLVAEVARDSFEDAINYARSMKNDAFKLMCLIQIAQALSQSNN